MRKLLFLPFLLCSLHQTYAASATRAALHVGFVGLGRMGAPMSSRLAARGHGVKVLGYDTNPKVRPTGVKRAASIEDLVKQLPGRRKVIWLMLPSAKVIDETLEKLTTLLKPGDVVIDGGNSDYQLTLQRAEMLKAHGITLVDVGTSGGILGKKEGYSLMVGGDKRTVRTLRPVFAALAPTPTTGWGHVGPTGSGHFVKMVHNGVEYAWMQGLGEGLSLVHAAGINPAKAARIWQQGSILRSLLVDLAAKSLRVDDVAKIKPEVADTGEGRWTVRAAVDKGVPVPTIATALFSRTSSQGKGDFGWRLQAALRGRFGGHAVPRKQK
jgi:6-phosphogluconate dehydrogenase